MMRREIKIILLIIITVFSLNTLVSQDKKSKFSIELLETFTDTQKELLEKERKYLDKQRTSIRKTFNDSQLEIISDTTISKREKKKMIIESFSNDQKRIIERYDKRIDTIRKKFNRTLSKNQRILITKIKRKKSKKNE
jgi:glutamate/tyrosine decarboxylase-like PLP-dependent enzyme